LLKCTATAAAAAAAAASNNNKLNPNRTHEHTHTLGLAAVLSIGQAISKVKQTKHSVLSLWTSSIFIDRHGNHSDLIK
jgi:hypothetical protein